MANSLEVTDRNLQEFISVQKSMLLAREEGAKKTYDSLKERYVYLKAMLNVAGVNLSEIDKIKE